MEIKQCLYVHLTSPTLVINYSGFCLELRIIIKTKYTVIIIINYCSFMDEVLHLSYQ